MDGNRGHSGFGWGSWITSLGLVLVFGFGLFLAYPFYRQEQGLRQREADLQRRIDFKNREIAQLKDYQRRFVTDPDFLASIAHQNHRLFPGELVFVFGDK